jgi:hypothetical protein
MIEKLQTPEEYIKDTIQHKLTRHRRVNVAITSLVGVSELGGGMVVLFSDHSKVGLGAMTAAAITMTLYHRFGKSSQTVFEEASQEAKKGVIRLREIREKAIDAPFEVK